MLDACCGHMSYVNRDLLTSVHVEMSAATPVSPVNRNPSYENIVIIGETRYARLWVLIKVGTGNEEMSWK